MPIATWSIRNPVAIWLLIVTCFAGGLWGLVTIGKLEDPSFTIGLAVVSTGYPGATAEEVEREITEPLESAIQQLPQLRRVMSRSLPGRSEITVELSYELGSEAIPQAWDELRRKINDTAPNLPNSSEPPIINDDFGDVFGIFYAITTDGFSDRDVIDLATFLRREVLTVNGVSKAEVSGLPEESIYVEVSLDRLASLGMPLDAVVDTLRSESVVAPSGSTPMADRRVRLNSPPALDSVSAIETLRIGVPGTTQQLSIFDVAEVSREPTETPGQLIRHNGKPAFTLAVAGQDHLNIVRVGQDVDRHLEDLRDRLPLGVNIDPVYQQHVVVEEAINDFIFSLLLSVSIVIGVLCIAMGWRVGMVVGITLLLTVLGSVFFMRVFSIEMERISLGALIIAMGMLVDNAIVVAEAMLINMQRGKDSVKAAEDAARRTQIPLLGATVIGIMAFAAIGLSPDVTGEFLFSLFAVILISLLLSWVLAVTVTPLFGHYFFRADASNSDEDPYRGRLYQRYRNLLAATLRWRWLTVMLLVAITVISVIGFGQVKQGFFPPSNTPLFFINYHLPQGSDIRATERDMRELERWMLEQDGVTDVTTMIGRGASRFMLTYAPELSNPSYGQLIVRADHRDSIPGLIRTVRKELPPRYPDAEIYPKQLMFGPGDGGDLEARFSGPDARVLRELAEQASQIMRSTPGIIDVRHDWRERELVIEPQFDEARARMAGINRTDVTNALTFATSGQQAGNYRENERHIPIVVRPPEEERLDLNQLHDRLIWSNSEQTYVPISQVVTGFVTRHEEAQIHRRDRVRTLTVQADPEGELTATDALNRFRSEVEAIELPRGYRLEWGGEYEGSKEAQQLLGQQLPISFIIMLAISILLFGALRQALVIWLIVPMSICGVTAGLLLTGMPFTFTALLGLLSLSGMLMKNAIVLVDEADNQARQQGNTLNALLDASVSRLRPVVLAALTTILGMIPLLWDAFFASMAITIMGGLAFASILTLVAAPVFYALIFRVPRTTPAAP